MEKANRITRQHKDFIQGIHVDDVAQKGDVLVFRGEYYLENE
ncbi:DUF2498 family protein [Photorhabdus sp. SF281]